MVEQLINLIIAGAPVALMAAADKAKPGEGDSGQARILGVNRNAVNRSCMS